MNMKNLPPLNICILIIFFVFGAYFSVWGFALYIRDDPAINWSCSPEANDFMKECSVRKTLIRCKYITYELFCK